MVSSNFYMDWLSLVFASVVVIQGIASYKKLGMLRIFVFYSLLSFIQTALSKLIVFSNPLGLKRTPFIELSFATFVLFESVVFLIFFYKALNPEFRKTAAFLSGLMLLIFTWELVSHDSWYFIPNIFTLIEGGCFLALSVIFYVQLFSDPPLSILVSSHIFWTANAIFFLFALVVPVFLLKPVISTALPSIIDGLYSFNYLAYCVFFGCLSKAISCKIKVQN